MPARRIAFLADENCNNDLLRALLRQLPDLDVIRAQDTEIAGVDDPTLLAWAAQQGRILLTHDVQTVPNVAYARVPAGQPMPGVVEVSGTAALGGLLADLVLLILATGDDEWSNQIKFVPLR